MKKIALIALCVLACMAVVSCGNAKKVAENPTTTVDSGKFAGKYDSRYIEYGFAKSFNKSQAYRNALRDAQQNLATRLYRSLSAVDSEFGEDTENGTRLGSMSKRTERFVGVIDDKVMTIHNIAEPRFEKDASGAYECSVEVVLDNTMVAEVAKALYQSISDDDALKVKFEEKQFIEEYEKQLREFRDRNAQK